MDEGSTGSVRGGGSGQGTLLTRDWVDRNFGYVIKTDDWDYKRVRLLLVVALPEYGEGKWQLSVDGVWLRPIETIEELMVQLDMVSPFVMLGE